MTASRPSSIPILSFLIAATLIGCAGPSPEELDADDAESEENLTGTTCSIGGTCRGSLQLLSAVSLPSAGQRKKRLDVAVTLGGTSNPRITRQATTGQLRFARPDTPLTLKLRGPLPGSPVLVDDVLLFEVLDPATGAVTSAAWTGGIGDTKVSLSGTELRRLGKPGFGQDAGLIDLGAILPRDKAFRLRVSALDLGGPTYVSDVYADIVSNAAPPPPAGPPWSVGACTGPQITRAELLTRFAPGSTTSSLGRFVMNARQRACQDVTTCGEWQPAGAVPFNQYVWTGHHFSFREGPTRTIAVPASGNAALSLKGTDIVLTLGLDAAPLSITSFAQFPFSEIAYGGGTDYFVGSDVNTLSNRQLTNAQTVTNACLYAETFGREYKKLQGGATDGTYTEYHVVWSGSY
jgi:hypothetical protein